MNPHLQKSIEKLSPAHQAVVRTVVEEFVWQLDNPDYLRIYGDRYMELTQEAALTIAQAIKVKNGGETKTQIPVEKEP